MAEQVIENAENAFADADVAEINNLEENRHGLRRVLLELIRRAQILAPVEPPAVAIEVPNLRNARARVAERVGQLRSTELLLPPFFLGDDIKATESHVSGFTDFTQKQNNRNNSQRYTPRDDSGGRSRRNETLTINLNGDRQQPTK
jgi:hypothetical protein